MAARKQAARRPRARQRVRVVHARPARALTARFDAAQTTPENRKHWANADGLSADAAARPDVRRIVRNRGRYEVANNSYARGIVLTLANDVIGTGPRLQMLTDSAEANQIIEREFIAWAKAVDLPAKLRTMRMARAQDGEAFAMLFTNGNLDSPVKLDLRLIEAEQVATPGFASGYAGAGPDRVDGIVFDEFGNPAQYHVLKVHPGAGGLAGSEYDRVAAGAMLHWFRQDRPGQRRGLPDILPALPLFAQLRRYTLAVIEAAESAANIAVFMTTANPPPGEEDVPAVEPLAEMEFARNMALFMPEGWQPNQIKAEQPATTYDMFKREILNEIARCLNMPYNIAACNSSAYNYASGRLDHQTYFKNIHVEQGQCEQVVLDPILSAWLVEAVKVFGLDMPSSAKASGFAKATPDKSAGTDAPHQWFWDGREHVDPAKEANAQETRLGSNTTTLAAEYARQGKDWEQELRQRAREIKLMRQLGLPEPQAKPRSPGSIEQAAERLIQELEDTGYALPERT